jgi:hypothetical protein
MWATVKASMVEVIPKRTSSAIHPDALGVEVGVVPADMSADYKGPQNTPVSCGFSFWRV